MEGTNYYPWPGVSEIRVSLLVTQRLRKGTTSETKVDTKKGDKKDKKTAKMSDTVSFVYLLLKVL